MTDKYELFKKWINKSKYGFVNTQEMELVRDKKIFEKFESSYYYRRLVINGQNDID